MIFFRCKILLLLCLSLLQFKATANEEFVLKTESSFKPTYENRLSFLVGLNPSIKTGQEVKNFTFSYLKKMSDFWFDTSFAITNGAFNKLTTNNPTATSSSNAQLLGSKSTMMSIGAGVARETRYIQTLLPFNDFYELMSADLTYNFYKETISQKSFNGPGLMAKFSAYKKFNSACSFGPQFIYNLAVVKRGADFQNETSSARSLTMSYLTIGFDLSFFL